MSHQGNPVSKSTILCKFLLGWRHASVECQVLAMSLSGLCKLNLFLAALGLHCYAQAFSSCSELGLLLVVVRGLLSVVASHCKAWPLGTWASVVVARRLQSRDSVIVVQGLSCPMACGIFLDQGFLSWEVLAFLLNFYFDGFST